MSASRQRPASHLLPTLFDRLCDDTPNQKRDHDISVSPVQLKEIIRRDLSFLLNTVSHEDDIDAARYPHAAASVLNYGLLVYGRGVSCELTVDEEGFSGVSPYLFGLVLEHYIARHVSINTFSQMTLHSMQRGKIMTWPVRAGQRGSV